MKKIISLFSIVVFMFIILTGCSNQIDEKMCRIEICDSNNNVIAQSVNQSQADITEFFKEEDWEATSYSADSLITEYVISVYQEKTKTVMQSEHDEEYEKIMEYVIFKNSDIVKVSVGGDIVGDIVADAVLDEYYIASSDFFTKIDALISTEAV